MFPVVSRAASIPLKAAHPRTLSDVQLSRMQAARTANTPVWQAFKPPLPSAGFVAQKCALVQPMAQSDVNFTCDSGASAFGYVGKATITVTAANGALIQGTANQALGLSYGDSFFVLAVVSGQTGRPEPKLAGPKVDDGAGQNATTAAYNANNAPPGTYSAYIGAMVLIDTEIMLVSGRSGATFSVQSVDCSSILKTISNGNPAQIQFSSTCLDDNYSLLRLSGATGAWSAVNGDYAPDGQRDTNYNLRRVSPPFVSGVYIDSTAAGDFSRQTLLAVAYYRGYLKSYIDAHPAGATVRKYSANYTDYNGVFYGEAVSAGDKTYTDAAALSVLGALAQYSYTLNGVNELRDHGWNCAWAYDLSANSLPPSDRAAAVKALTRLSDFLYQKGFYPAYLQPNCGGDVAAPYQCVRDDEAVGNKTIGGAVAALFLNAALHGDVAAFGDGSTPQQRWDALMMFIKGQFYRGMQNWSAGGLTPEGTGYGQENQRYAALVWEIVRDATGEDLSSTSPVDMPADLFNLYRMTSTAIVSGQRATFPWRDVQQQNGTGDNEELIWNDQARYTAYILSDYFEQKGDAAKARQMAFFYRTWVPRFVASNWNDADLLYDPNGRDQDDFRAGDLNYHAAGVGAAVSRSSWDESATVAGIIAGTNQGEHVHSDAGTVFLYRNNVPLTREHSGYDPQNSNINPSSFDAQNVTGQLRANETAFNGTRYHDSILAGGHGAATQFTGTNCAAPCRALMTLYEAAPNNQYVFAQVDLTGLYVATSPNWASLGARDTTRQVLRNWLYLKPDIVIVSDRVLFSSPDRAVAYFQHFSNPVIKGNYMTSGNGGQSLDVFVVAPASPRIVTIDQSTEGSLKNWRTETYAPADATEQSLMHILAGRGSGAAPITLGALKATNLDAAQFTYRSQQYIVASVQSVHPAKNFSYSFSPGEVTHYVLGLRPNTAYAVARKDGAVTISAAKGGADDVTTTKAGVLTFATAAATAVSQSR